MVTMPPSALFLNSGGGAEVSVMDCKPAAPSWKLLMLHEMRCTHVYVCLRGVITKHAAREDVCPPASAALSHTVSH